MQTRPISVDDGDVLLMVGTMKGAFLARASPDRRRWEWGGPYFQGRAVYAMAYDGRAGRNRLWAAAASMHWGSVLCSSDDFGRTWTEPTEANVKFPSDAGLELKEIWQIALGRAEEPDTLYCGVNPASLFESKDAGKTWALVRGLHEHPHRAKWQPGFGGLCLHTILPDPTRRERMVIAISTGGVYVTEDGGKSWRSSNKGVRAQFLPDPNPEFGQCVHKIVQHPERPERLFLQNHWGLYRSDDGGQSWQDIANGVPSDFGFPIGIHPRDPDTAFIIPLESDMFRVTPEGKLRVFRTKNAGESWEPLTKGLPQNEAFETVLRDGLAVDALDPAGVYFGTRSGKVFGSRDEGKSWSLLHEGLPPVTCVKVALTSERTVVARGKRPAAKKPAPAKKPAAAKKPAPRKNARARA